MLEILGPPPTQQALPASYQMMSPGAASGSQGSLLSQQQRMNSAGYPPPSSMYYSQQQQKWPPTNESGHFAPQPGGQAVSQQPYAANQTPQMPGGGYPPQGFQPAPPGAQTAQVCLCFFIHFENLNKPNLIYESKNMDLDARIWLWSESDEVWLWPNTTWISSSL